MVVGPGGVGKGTLVRRLIETDDRLWLSRSWTTRAPRPGEPDDAYVWVSPEQFEDRVAAGGFFEWARFLDHLYGTPTPEAPPGCDVLLEIEVQGAEQVKAQAAEAVVILLVPPSEAEQAARLRARGETEERVQERIAAGRVEIARARALADHVVVNDRLDDAVAEVAGIIVSHRAGPARS